VIITVYHDKSFTFIMKSPPASVLLKRAAGLAKGSAVPNREMVGQVTREQCREIVRQKMKDLVSRASRVGDSWPVLNAGSRLATDKYFFEIQPGKTGGYEGEVVVYSSFIARVR
jgi:hypothetical protein